MSRLNTTILEQKCAVSTSKVRNRSERNTARNIRLERFNEIQSQQGVHSHLGKIILIERRNARGVNRRISRNFIFCAVVVLGFNRLIGICVVQSTGPIIAACSRIISG